MSVVAASLLATAACTATSEPGDAAPTGFYHLETETVRDDCAPARSIQSASGLPVFSSARSVVVPYPQGAAIDATVPWAHATALRRPASPTILGDLDCPGATSTLELEIAGETATSLEVDLVESWSGLASCTAPSRPAADCRSERILHFELEEACEAPCELVPNDCADEGCTIGDRAWRCTCDEPLL